ncbi:hypothetical protein [Paraburkholderia caribensis]|uniref:hypothetical protein n=1 Tax=Paraburkholderia caribensis TaxID=75105 RepID=UPI001CC4ADB3|nr:hypothetical protein [Paraburkholderia caribensis]
MSKKRLPELTVAGVTLKRALRQFSHFAGPAEFMETDMVTGARMQAKIAVYEARCSDATTSRPPAIELRAEITPDPFEDVSGWSPAELLAVFSPLIREHAERLPVSPRLSDIGREMTVVVERTGVEAGSGMTRIARIDILVSDGTASGRVIVRGMPDAELRMVSVGGDDKVWDVIESVLAAGQGHAKAT